MFMLQTTFSFFNRLINIRRKTIISKFLISLIVLQSLFSILGLANVYSAGIELNNETTNKLTSRFNNELANFKYSLKEGKTDQSPIFEIKNLENDKTFFEWGFSSDNATYHLQYPLENNKIAQFSVTKSGTFANVSYKVFPFLAPKDANGVYISGYDVTLLSTYQIHLNNGSNKPNYLGYTSSPIYPSDNQSNSSHVVTGSDTPVFQIADKTGYSFKFNNRTMHFLWNSSEFYFMSDGFKNGQLFPAQLYSKEVGAADFTLINNNNILTGIDKLGFKSEAISAGNKIDYVLDSEAGDPLPAENPNELELTIPVPKIWIGGKFDYPNSISDIPLDLDVMLRPYKESKNIQVKIKGLSNTNLVPDIKVYGTGAGEGDSDVVIKNAETILDGGKATSIKFTLSQLPSSRIYTTDFLISSKPKYSSNSSSASFGEVYTFLEYKFDVVADKYNVVVDTPYKNVLGVYKLLMGGNEISQIKSDGSGKKLYFTIPISLGTVEEHEYKIMFSPEVDFQKDTQAVPSQTINHKTKISDVSIGMADNFEVVDYDFVLDTTGINAGEKGSLDIALRFDIGEKEVIDANIERSDSNPKSFDVKYKVYKTLDPKKAEASGDGLLEFGEITIKIKKLGPNNYTASYSCNKPELLKIDLEESSPYKTEDRKFQGEDIGINSQNGKTIFKANFKLSTFAYNKNKIPIGIIPEDFEFTYPNIYFLNVKPTNIEIENSGGNIKIELQGTPSVFDSLTLDDFGSKDAVSPQNLNVYDPITLELPDGTTSETSLKVSWLAKGKDIKDFFKSFGTTKTERVKYNLYVSQNDKKLNSILSKVNPITNLPEATTLSERKLSSVIYTYVDKTSENTDSLVKDTIYFSNLTGGVPLSNGGKMPIDELREGNIVCVSDIFMTNAEIESLLKGNDEILNFKIDGLDKNQSYFFAVDAVMEFEKDDPLNPPLVTTFLLESAPLGIKGEVTKAKAEKPELIDNVPPAPVLNKKDVSLDSATIFWKEIVDYFSNENNPSVIEYEIIKTTGEEIEDELLDSKIDIETFFGTTINVKEKIALKTEGNNILVYDGKSFSEDKDKSFLLERGDTLTLIDNSLTPNQLYFYYVRTTKTVEGKTVYSSWSNISVTSTPIKEPLFLKVERDIDKLGSVVIDKEKEFVISFFAPINDVSRLGADFDIVYSIQQENFPWSSNIVMDSKLLQEKQSYIEGLKTDSTIVGKENYTKFFYKIKVNSSGKNYSIKVAMLDLASKETSMYSNTAYAKTKINQEDYKKEDEKLSWEDYIKSEFSNILKENYWNLGNNEQLFFKPSHFTNLTKNEENGLIELLNEDYREKNSRNTFYISLNELQKAISLNNSFVIKKGNLEIIIPAKVIDISKNEQINLLKEKQRKLSGKDIFVSIEVFNFDEVKTIDGNNTITGEIDIRLNILSTKQTAIKLSDAISNKADLEIKNQLENKVFKKELKEMIDKNTDAKFIIKFIAEYEKEIRKKVNDYADKLFRDSILETNRVENIETPITVRVKYFEKIEKVFAYVNDKGKYKSVVVIDESSLNNDKNVRAVYLDNVGIIVFTGNTKSNISENIRLKEYFAKFGIDKNVKIQTPNDLNSPVTVADLEAIVASLMGNNRSNDPRKFLLDKGISIRDEEISINENPNAISNKDANNFYATKEEGIYLLCKIYESKTNSSIDDLTIRNKSLIANLENVSDKYKKSVLAMNEFVVLNNTDQVFYSNDTLSYEDFFEMLLKLESVAKIY